MKITYSFIFSFMFLCTILAQNQKEVFIIGTMHSVPKVVKNSYKPLLKLAKDYNPDAIYVERVRPEDSLSLKHYYSRFLSYSDSVRKEFTIDPVKFEALMTMDLVDMKKQDFKYLSKAFLVERDYANYSYYRYLSHHCLKGSKRPYRNENGDLTAKLAIAQNMKYIYSMDDQQENPLYSEAWHTCATEGKENGNEKEVNKLLRQLTLAEIFPATLGQLGKQINHPKALEKMHLVNSFEYVKVNTEACSLGNQYWDNRNCRMVKNIVEQVQAQEHQRNIVIVGAGHVYGMKEAFEQHFPGIKVKLVADL
ncbi:MAG: DUF5694 domain-containing protein [Bacteroidota bacterium]